MCPWIGGLVDWWIGVLVAWCIGGLVDWWVGGLVYWWFERAGVHPALSLPAESPDFVGAPESSMAMKSPCYQVRKSLEFTSSNPAVSAFPEVAVESHLNSKSG